MRASYLYNQWRLGGNYNREVAAYSYSCVGGGDCSFVSPSTLVAEGECEVAAASWRAYWGKYYSVEANSGEPEGGCGRYKEAAERLRRLNQRLSGDPRPVSFARRIWQVAGEMYMLWHFSRDFSLALDRYEEEYKKLRPLLNGKQEVPK